ncbi:antibiotic biosynthesis monooxygenase [Agrococcus sp. Marseille-P2731]|uniref:antibiotic biosynthesis monooxygenase n=1 Tax=Agrococcus sp. Marseille-P2731 TaxID=1841862 RepID=UPI00092FFF79|nr:antibiotic biosynthesis monooxygenase [Agrococcus sp. Marseille-P2731]
MEQAPITVAIERVVDPRMDRYAQAWAQHGVDLASRFEGFLGAGWVRESRRTQRWHMIYRFEDRVTLDAWEQSPERQQWIAGGASFAKESRVERRSGIEGWFDAPAGVVVEDDARVEIRQVTAAPPVWKQMIVVWLAFFPMNVLVTWLLGLIPGFGELALPLRLLVSTVILTPIMVGLILPFITRLAAPWLHPRRER